MKLGMNYDLHRKSPEKWAEKLVSLGARAVSFPVDYHADFHLIEQYKEAAAANHLVIAEVGVWANPLSPDPKERAKAMERAVEQLKLADYVGARCCVNVAGSAGRVWDGYDPMNFSPDFYLRTVESIQEILRNAHPENTFYAIEPMPYMVPSGPDEYVQLLNDVNSPKFGVHLDMTNWMNSMDRLRNQQEFMDSVFLKLHGRIKSCHLKDCAVLNRLSFQVQEIPAGKGMFDIDYFLRKVDEEDVHMPVLIEHLKWGFQSNRLLKQLTDKYGQDGGPSPEELRME